MEKSSYIQKTFVNPLYRDKDQEKTNEGAQRPEEKILNIIVPEKKEKSNLVPKKYKSTTPRDSRIRSTTERTPIGLTPARRKGKPEAGLTKIEPPVFSAKMSDAVSPRGKYSTTKRSPIMEKKKSDKSLEPVIAEDVVIEENVVIAENVAIAEDVVNAEKKNESEERFETAKLELVEFHHAITVDEDSEFYQKQRITTDARKQLAHKNRSSILPSKASQIKQIARPVGDMIQELNEPGSASEMLRSLNILHYVNSGVTVLDKSCHPEIELFPKDAFKFLNEEKITCLRLLYLSVEKHLNLRQRKELGSSDFDQLDGKLRLQLVGPMIRELNYPDSASKAMRALNLLRYLYSEETVLDKIIHPEIEIFASHSVRFSTESLATNLEFLFNELKEFLSPKQQGAFQFAFSAMKKGKEKKGIPSFELLSTELNWQLRIQVEADKRERLIQTQGDL